jgi:hypothetical protein
MAFFQAHVPLGAYPGEHRDLFAAEARHPSAAAARWQADVLGGQLGAAGGKEFTDRGSVVGRFHDFYATAASGVYRGLC